MTGIRLVAVGLGVLAVLAVSAAVMGEMPGWMIPVGVVAMVTVFIGAVVSDSTSPTITKRFPNDGVVHAEPYQDSTIRALFGPKAVAPETWDAIPAVHAPRGDGYRAYLLTPEWQQRRTLVLKACGYRCMVCNSATRINVHHRTYARAGNERFDDLVALCRDCHGLFHAQGRIA